MLNSLFKSKYVRKEIAGTQKNEIVAHVTKGPVESVIDAGYMSDNSEDEQEGTVIKYDGLERISLSTDAAQPNKKVKKPKWDEEKRRMMKALKSGGLPVPKKVSASQVAQAEGKQMQMQSVQGVESQEPRTTSDPTHTPESKPDRLSDHLENTAFVGNVPIGTTPKELKKYISAMDIGSVDSVRVRSVPVAAGRGKAVGKEQMRRLVLTKEYNDSNAAQSFNAYVVFRDASSVAQCVSKLNGNVFGGRHLRVTPCAAVAGPKQGTRGNGLDDSRSVFVGNLPFDADDEEVWSLFAGQTAGGEPGQAAASGSDAVVTGVRLIKEKGSRNGKGFGFVELAEEAMVARVVKAPLALRGRVLRLMAVGQAAGKKKRAAGGRAARRQAAAGGRGGQVAKGVQKPSETRARKPSSRRGRTTRSARWKEESRSKSKGAGARSFQGMRSSEKM